MGRAPDFLVTIAILDARKGGCNTPPHNFMRWDFGYPADHAEDARDV